MGGCLSDNPSSVRVFLKNHFVEIDSVTNGGEFGGKFLGKTIRRFYLQKPGVL